MEIVEDLIEFVNKQVAFYAHQLASNKVLKSRAKFEELHSNFLKLAQFLVQLKDNSCLPQSQPIPKSAVVLTPVDVEGLPPELLKELNISESDQSEFDIVSLVKRNGGIMSLDHILIALYRETGVIHKRNLLTSKLYRMAKKELLYNVPGKRGVYSIEPMPGSQELAAEEQGGTDSE